MARFTALVAKRGNHLKWKLILHVQRIVVIGYRLWVGRKSCYSSDASSGQIVGAEGRDGRRIGSIPEDGVGAGRCLVENSRRIGGRSRAAEVFVHDVRRVTESVGKNCDLVLVVVDAETAADYQFVHRFRGLPCKADLRTKIVLLWVVERAPDMNVQAIQQIRAGSEFQYVQVVLLGGERSEV